MGLSFTQTDGNEDIFYPLPWKGLAEEGFSISVLHPAKTIQVIDKDTFIDP